MDTELQDQTSKEESTVNQTVTYFDINGQKMSADEVVKSYKSLQSDYTRKSQELSDIKKRKELSEDELVEVKKLEELGFVKREELERFSQDHSESQTLSQIMSSNPSLKKFEKAIREIRKTSNKSYEDIINEYGFIGKERQMKSDIVGESNITEPKKVKSIRDMSDKEYEQFKKENLTGSTFFK